MRGAELLLRHAQLEGQVRSVSADIERLEAVLARDAAVEAAAERLETARAGQREVSRRLRDREREVAEHRARLRDRDRELMSGRIRNPTELSRLSEEVEHMKARVAVEEDEELNLMEQLEEHDAAVAAAEDELARLQQRREQQAPELQRQLEAARSSLTVAEGERDRVWAEVPSELQAAARRIRAHPPVAEVVNGQCSACHVAVTSGTRQQLRRDALVTCDNCGRILVLG
jgi:predicted  nucleic acid-binding Zn-ribbon protein